MELGKIRLSGLVVATTASGYYMGCAEFDPATFACTIAGTTLAALSANTLNQWYEVIDRTPAPTCTSASVIYSELRIIGPHS